ncbi:MAG: mechanosensitive ion channel family protein [Candidatus Thermoplasmatota archaeon]|jgi:small-conductance mechanosensitive channel|nr:mechanosensitive ion channel family protein [Candidatus Thermoplasmatota archaeon]
MSSRVPTVGRETLKAIGIISIGIIVLVTFQYFLYPSVEAYYPFLKSYDLYMRDAIAAAVIFGFAYIILRGIKQAIEITSQKRTKRNIRGLYTILRAVVYGIAIAVFLEYMGVSLTGALIGGTVGGLILSFALQSTVSSLLSGLLLASAGIVKPKDKVSYYSWMFDNPVIGEVVDVKLLTVQVKDIDGYVVELPNTALLSQSEFKILGYNSNIRATVSAALPVDAQIRGIIDIASNSLEKKKDDLGLTNFQMYFYTKTFNSNTVKVIIDFRRMEDFNSISHAINVALEEGYWEMKNRAPQGNNIILGFPVDVPIREVMKGGDSLLGQKSGDAGLLEFRSFFFTKAFTTNSIKVSFSLKKGASYDVVADAINTSYEEAYLNLKNKMKENK